MYGKTFDILQKERLWLISAKYFRNIKEKSTSGLSKPKFFSCKRKRLTRKTCT